MLARESTDVLRLVVAGVVLTMSFAGALAAADVPSLEEIKAGLKSRHEKIRSLYVETVGETTSPFEPEELGRLRSYYKSWVGRKVEYHYAFRGENRYSREKGVEDRPSYDNMMSYNGASVWSRDTYETVHSDGTVERKKPRVVILPPHGRHRFMYPNEWFCIHLGAVIVGPDFAAEDSMRDVFYYGSPPSSVWRTLTVSDQIDDVDGAQCVVVVGTIERTFTSEGETHKSIREVKLWLDIERDLALRKWQETETFRKKYPKQISRVVNSRFKAMGPGLWLPQEMEIQRIAPADEEAYPEQFRGKVILSTRIRVTKCIVNQVPDDVFDPHIEPGDGVYDERDAPELGRYGVWQDAEQIIEALTSGRGLATVGMRSAGLLVPLSRPRLAIITALNALRRGPVSTLASLEQVDDYPLFVMTYRGTYFFDWFAKHGIDWTVYRAIGKLVDPEACASFTARTPEGDAIFARNFDWNNRPSLLLFTDPPGGYASVSMVDLYYLGFEGTQAPPLLSRLKLLATPYVTFDGMNECGLAIASNAVGGGGKAPWDPDKPTLGPNQMMRLMLDHAKDVDEALGLLRNYNVNDSVPGYTLPTHFHIADASGNSVVVEYVDGKRIVVSSGAAWQVSTNFLITKAQPKGAASQCPRYNTSYESLEKADGTLSQDEAMHLLKSISRDHTMWSVVYNLSTGEIRVAMGRKYGRMHTFKLDMISSPETDSHPVD